MDTASFYRSILPELGLRALAVFKHGLKNGAPTHYFYEGNEDLIEAAETYDRLGKNVYHGCATYATDSNRKGSNAAAVKSLWVDMDVGPNKPYATQKEAATDLEKFRAAVGLSTPHIVSSGGGVHAYFAFTKPIAPDKWQKLAAVFAACLNQFGVKHDSSRTEDVASILRVPGTQNYKGDAPRPVTLKRLGIEESAGSIYTKLKAFADSNGVQVLETIKPSKVQATNELVGTQSYPPSVYMDITARCPVLNEVESTGGDVSFDIWWRAMGVAKHTTTPEEAAAHWTRHRAETNHDKYDWQKAISEWNTGPTTCAGFSKHSTKCGSCVYNGQITSPIQLGTTEVANEITQPDPQQPWTFRPDWLLGLLKNRRVGCDNGKLVHIGADENGTPTRTPFCDRYWQVMNRVRSQEGTWQLEIAYEEYKTVRTFLMDSAAVTSPDLLRKSFSTHEIHIYGGTKSMLKTQEILIFEQGMLHDYMSEVATYPRMGWCTVGNTPSGELTGEFVIGTERYAPKKGPIAIELSDRIDVSLRADFRTKGTTDEWVALIDRVYNRPGAEAYQFVIASMFAAPLIRLTSGGEWHGIPIALTGDSGAAKTTTALVAMSVYAPPSILRFNGNSSKDGGQGDTPAALGIKMGSLSNLPFIIDEVTGVEADKLAQIMFMLSNGKSKDRAESSGKKLIDNFHRWDTTSIITGNDSLHERLRELRRQNAQDATMLRCFEVPIHKSDLKRVFFDVHRTVVEEELLAQQYGAVGREWIQFIVDKREEIADLLKKQRAKFEITDSDMSDIRFYKDLLINVQVAAAYAKKAGYIRWDLKAMMQWARTQLIRLRDGVNEKDWEGNISDFVASLYGRTIVTSKMHLGRGRRSVTFSEQPRELLSPNKIPVARKAIDDKVFVVTANAVREWCVENRVTYSAFLHEMTQRNYLKFRPGEDINKPRMLNIGSGTTITRPQSPCFEFDYNYITSYEDDAGSGDGDSNVVQFPDKPPSPAPAPAAEGEVATT